MSQEQGENCRLVFWFSKLSYNQGGHKSSCIAALEGESICPAINVLTLDTFSRAHLEGCAPTGIKAWHASI